MMRDVRACALLALVATAACRPADDGSGAVALGLDEIAERYVKIALALRPHDPDYVDAYYGPAEWADAAAAEVTSLESLREQTDALVEAVDATLRSAAGGASGATEAADVATRRRAAALRKRLTSMRLRMDMADGRTLPFDEETAALFDAVAPEREAGEFAAIRERVEALLPGEGPLAERYQRFREQFVIPRDRLAAVFEAAIAECRRRTLEHIELPDDEHLAIEYVTDQSWSGYNWYKGSRFSVIQINTDLPIYIDRAVDLGCHEGYPGHHTANALSEHNLVDGRGWIEYTLSPLYGPSSLIAEGSANYGIELAFPNDERERFEMETLFPIAGLDPRQAGRYYALLDALEGLDYASNQAARGYLDGERDQEETIVWLMETTLAPRPRAEQRVRFIERYRSYVINYNLGRDLVAAFVEERAGDDRARQWQVFEGVLSEPITPSELQSAP